MKVYVLETGCHDDIWDVYTTPEKAMAAHGPRRPRLRWHLNAKVADWETYTWGERKEFKAITTGPLARWHFQADSDDAATVYEFEVK